MSRNLQDTGNRQELPLVVLFIHNRKEINIKTQKYPNLIIVTGDSGTAPEFFQSGILEHNYDCIYGFLSEWDYLTSEYSIDYVVQALMSPNYAAAYTDSIHCTKFGDIPQILPSFSPDTIQNFTINTPLFLHSSLAQDWSNEYNTMYFYDYFMKLAKKNIVYHIPEPIIATLTHYLDIEESKSIRNKYVSN